MPALNRTLPTKLLLLLLAFPFLLGSCASRDEEFAEAIDKLQIDQQLHEIRIGLVEEELDQQKSRIEGLQTTLEKMLYPLPGGAAANASSTVSSQTTGQAPRQASGTTASGKPANSASQTATTSPKAKSPERQAYDSALSMLLNGNPKSAEPMFTDFLNRYPNSALAANAEYWLGECFYGQGRYGEAILAFQNVAALHPKHNKAPAALLKTGFSYERLADNQNAVFYLEQLVEAYPNSEPAPQARKALQRLR
ncbi:tol-pal system protein YbgF [Desulfovibrio sp. OttesenSCG-928-C06]|nr:tol-pal system protein YbgF [Desulfovibrio sp. OttesenSCG-928-C06]